MCQSLLSLPIVPLGVNSNLCFQKTTVMGCLVIMFVKEVECFHDLNVKCPHRLMLEHLILQVVLLVL